jgi:DNA-binding Xre family transcriptional regulator
MMSAGDGQSSTWLLPLWSWSSWFCTVRIDGHGWPTSEVGQECPRRPQRTRLAQEELSARTKLAVVQISRIERGKREIRLGTLIRLVDGLDIPPNVLLRGLYRGRTRR